MAEIKVQFQRLADFSNRKRNMSLRADDVARRLNSLKGSLDWDIKSSSSIDFRLSELCRNVKAYVGVLTEMSNYLNRASREYLGCENEIANYQKNASNGDSISAGAPIGNGNDNEKQFDIFGFISNASGIVGRIANVLVAARINSGESLLNRVSLIINEIIGAVPGTTESSDLLKMIDSALNHGCKNVKLLTGARTVSEGRSILSTYQVIGNVGKVAGVVGTVVTPFTEINTSIDMFKDDLSLVAEYNPQEYKKALILASVSAAGDACSWGFVRSLAKTPSSLVRLIPGKDPEWTDWYDEAVNETYNTKSAINFFSGIYERTIDLKDKIQKSLNKN